MSSEYTLSISMYTYTERELFMCSCISLEVNIRCLSMYTCHTVLYVYVFSPLHFVTTYEHVASMQCSVLARSVYLDCVYTR